MVGRGRYLGDLRIPGALEMAVVRSPFAHAAIGEIDITDALATIGVDPTRFLERACRALTEADANYFQRLAQILARYHKSKTPLSSIGLENDRDRLAGVACSVYREREVRRCLSDDAREGPQVG